MPWVQGRAPAPPPPLDVPITLGLTGPNGEAIVGGGPDGGVRVVPERGGVPVDLATLTSIDWGDGTVDTPPDISGGFVAHVYQAVATGVSIKVTTSFGDTGTSATFDVIPAAAPPPTLTSFTPTDVATRYAPTTITATGTNFTAAAVLRINGVNQPTTWVSATTVTALFDPAGHAVGTFNVDVVDTAGTTNALPMRIADFIFNAPTRFDASTLDAAKHRLTTDEYSGTILFTGADSNYDQLMIQGWPQGGGDIVIVWMPIDAVMSSYLPSCASQSKMSALPWETEIYTFRTAVEGGMCISSHTPAAIGNAIGTLPGSTTGADYELVFDPAVIPALTNWKDLYTDGVRVPVPFAFSPTMTGGSSGWVSTTSMMDARSQEFFKVGFVAIPPAPLHPGYGEGSTSPGGVPTGELAVLDGQTVDIQHDSTLYSPNKYGPWHLSDPRTDVVYHVRNILVTGSPVEASIASSLIAWKTSDPAPLTTFLRRSPHDTAVATSVNVRYWDDVTSTWLPLLKADLTTQWTPTEIIAKVDTQITITRDASGVLVLS